MAKLVGRMNGFYPTSFLKGEHYPYCETEEGLMLVYMGYNVGNGKRMLSINNTFMIEITREKFDFYFMDSREHFYQNEKGVIR